MTLDQPEHHEQSLGPWEPWLIARAQRQLGDATFRWWISGGHALELWAGRSWRAHEDLDISLVRADLPLAAAQLSDCELLVAAAGVLSPYRGEQLTSAAHQNNVWVRDPRAGAYVLDLTLSDGDERSWIYRRDPSIRRPWSEAVLQSRDGVRYLAPELQLLFKSKAPRPKDTHDAHEIIPMLDDARRGFLRQALPSEHPWQGRL